MRYRKRATRLLRSGRLCEEAFLLNPKDKVVYEEEQMKVVNEDELDVVRHVPILWWRA